MTFYLGYHTSWSRLALKNAWYEYYIVTDFQGVPPVDRDILDQGTISEGRLSTIDLLIKIGDFVNKNKYKFSMKSSSSELFSTRTSSTVLIIPFH